MSPTPADRTTLSRPAVPRASVRPPASAVVSFHDYTRTRSREAHVLDAPPLDAFVGASGAAGLEPALGLVADALDVDLVLLGHVNGSEYTMVASFHREGELSLAKGAVIPIEETYCREEITSSTPFVLEDAAADETFAHHPGYAKRGLRAYVGVPVTLEDGTLFGTLCGADMRARTFTSEQVARLVLLSGVVSSELSRRLGIKAECEVDRALARALARASRPRVAALNRDGRSLSLSAELEAVNRRHAETIRRLRVAVDELEDFTQTVSHDLAEPLRGIETLTAYLAEEAGHAPREELSDTALRVRRTALRLKDRVRGMLEFSRVVRAEFSLEEEDMGRVVSHVLAGFENEIQEAGAHVVLPEAAFPTLPVQRVRVEQVLVNLLENALKHNPERGVRIEVGHREAGDQWEFWVRDDGVGIPREHHHRIFDVFQRGPNASERRGSGVGLAIVRKVAERHGGRAWVVSAPGSGASFHFTLAKAPADTNVAA